MSSKVELFGKAAMTFALRNVTLMTKADIAKCTRVRKVAVP
jgi:hypothetical protein